MSRGLMGTDSNAKVSLATGQNKQESKDQCRAFYFPEIYAEFYQRLRDNVRMGSRRGTEALCSGLIEHVTGSEDSQVTSS